MVRADPRRSIGTVVFASCHGCLIGRSEVDRYYNSPWKREGISDETPFRCIVAAYGLFANQRDGVLKVAVKPRWVSLVVGKPAGTPRQTSFVMRCRTGDEAHLRVLFS